MKLLVSDFKRFWDVLTVVWNNQTVATQKNASSTVNGIVGKSLTFRGPGDVQHVTEVVNGPTLLAWCEVFKREFGRNFAEWHSGVLTLEKLSETVVTLASTLRPCEVGRWIHAVRNTLLVLLGQIVAYFTISKSGPGHPRVTGDHNESDLAEACSGFLKRACVARSLETGPPLALVKFFSVDC